MTTHCISQQLILILWEDITFYILNDTFYQNPIDFWQLNTFEVFANVIKYVSFIDHMLR